MNENKVFDLVKKIFYKSEINHLAESLIIENDVGYELYNKYQITKINEKFCVQKHNSHLNKTFYSLRNAVIWTTFDKRNYLMDSDIIARLDIQLEGLDTNIQIYKNLCDKSKNYEAKIVYFTKLSENRIKRKYVMEKIDTYSQQVKIWQNKIFNEAVK